MKSAKELLAILRQTDETAKIEAKDCNQKVDREKVTTPRKKVATIRKKVATIRKKVATPRKKVATIPLNNSTGFLTNLGIG